MFVLEVSVLFNEPKLLKLNHDAARHRTRSGVSVLFNEPKLLKYVWNYAPTLIINVSVLFNEPKLLKFYHYYDYNFAQKSFSALQRAEIAEMLLIFKIVLKIPKLFQCSSTSRNC